MASLLKTNLALSFDWRIWMFNCLSTNLIFSHAFNATVISSPTCTRWFWSFLPEHVIHHRASRDQVFNEGAKSVSINNFRQLALCCVKRIPFRTCHEIAFVRLRSAVKVRAQAWALGPASGWLVMRTHDMSFPGSDSLCGDYEAAPILLSFIFFCLAPASNSNIQWVALIEDWIVDWFLGEDVLKSVFSCISKVSLINEFWTWNFKEIKSFVVVGVILWKHLSDVISIGVSCCSACSHLVLNLSCGSR